MPSHPVLAALQQAARGLSYMSESDYPVRVFALPAAVPGAEPDTAALRAAARQPADAPVAAASLERFFGPMTAEQPWHGPEDQQRVAGFRQLRSAMEEQLQDLQAFEVGAEPEMVLCVVGNADDGTPIGVYARVVET